MSDPWALCGAQSGMATMVMFDNGLVGYLYS